MLYAVAEQSIQLGHFHYISNQRDLHLLVRRLQQVARVCVRVCVVCCVRVCERVCVCARTQIISFMITSTNMLRLSCPLCVCGACVARVWRVYLRAHTYPKSKSFHFSSSM